MWEVALGPQCHLGDFRVFRPVARHGWRAPLVPLASTVHQLREGHLKASAIYSICYVACGHAEGVYCSGRNVEE